MILGLSRGLRQFFTEPVGESQSLRMAWAEKYTGLSVAGVLQKNEAQVGSRMRCCRSSFPEAF